MEIKVINSIKGRMLKIKYKNLFFVTAHKLCPAELNDPKTAKGSVTINHQL